MQSAFIQNHVEKTANFANIKTTKATKTIKTPQTACT